MYYFLQIFLCLVYIEQIFSNLIILTDDIIDFNINVKGYIIINFCYNIILLIYLFIRVGLNYKNKLKYDNEYFNYYDFWLFSLGFIMYFFGSTYFYSVMFDKEDRKILMENESFIIFLYSHIPIGSVFLTIVFLIFTSTIIFFISLLLHCCCSCNENSKIFPI